MSKLINFMNLPATFFTQSQPFTYFNRGFTCTPIMKTVGTETSERYVRQVHFSNLGSVLVLFKVAVSKSHYIM